MGMSTSIVFLRDKNDPQHQAKVKVLRACEEAGIDLPPEIDEYFGDGEGEDFPLEVDFEARE